MMHTAPMRVIALKIWKGFYKHNTYIHLYRLHFLPDNTILQKAFQDLHRHRVEWNKTSINQVKIFTFLNKNCDRIILNIYASLQQIHEIAINLIAGTAYLVDW